jgi:hypothetical protein
MAEDRIKSEFTLANQVRIREGAWLTAAIDTPAVTDDDIAWARKAGAAFVEVLNEALTAWADDKDACKVFRRKLKAVERKLATFDSKEASDV